jgi:hypothetical protein
MDFVVRRSSVVCSILRLRSGEVSPVELRKAEDSFLKESESDYVIPIPTGRDLHYVPTSGQAAESSALRVLTTKP